MNPRPGLVALLTLLLGSAAPAEEPRFDHVLVISVDGLRSDALMPATRSAQPNFRRLASGSATLNARTDASLTTTLPNHLSMITGRIARGPDGHGCTVNQFMAGDPLVHDRTGSYVACMYDVAHDHGVFTAMIATKAKFAIIDRSWDAEHGAPDRHLPDQGADKIDHYLHCLESTAVTDAVIEILTADHARTLLFAHYAAPDLAGHAAGWDLSSGSTYLEAVSAVDGELGRILDAAEAHPDLAGRTAIILTSDHGGGAPHRSHLRAEMWVNYIIPFLVWTGDGNPAADLYAVNGTTRKEPGLTQPTADADPAPIRSGDAANLALSLLGLPAVPGSTINEGQDLEVRPGTSGFPTGSSAPPGSSPAP